MSRGTAEAVEIGHLRGRATAEGDREICWGGLPRIGNEGLQRKLGNTIHIKPGEKCIGFFCTQCRSWFGHTIQDTPCGARGGRGSKAQQGACLLRCPPDDREPWARRQRLRGVRACDTPHTGPEEDREPPELCEGGRPVRPGGGGEAPARPGAFGWARGGWRGEGHGSHCTDKSEGGVRRPCGWCLRRAGTKLLPKMGTQNGRRCPSFVSSDGGTLSGP